METAPCRLPKLDPNVLVPLVNIMRSLVFLCLAAIGTMPSAAQVCGRDDVSGAYGFQLSGTTSIGADGPQPMVAIGRLVFDGQGGVTGVSSADLAGYFLGNPVTGSYTFKSDCSLTFALQDDSGAFQHFTGLAKPGGASIEIHQSDPDTGERGAMERTLESCDAASLRGAYNFTLSGIASQFDTEEAPGSKISIAGTVTADGAGNLTFTTSAGKTTGSYQLDSGCVAEIELGILEGNSAGILKLRGVLVKQGKLLLAVESDPARIASARFTAQ